MYSNLPAMICSCWFNSAGTPLIVLSCIRRSVFGSLTGMAEAEAEAGRRNRRTNWKRKQSAGQVKRSGGERLENSSTEGSA